MGILANIRVRLTLWYLLIVAILVTFAGTVSYILLSDSLSRKTIDPWEIQTADILPAVTSNDYEIVDLSRMAPQLGMTFSSRNTSVKGFTKTELLSMADENGVIHFKRSTGDGTVSIDSSLLSTEEMTDAHFIWFYFPQSNTSTRMFVVTQSAYNTAQTLYIFRQAILVIAVVTLILAGILGFFLVSRMLRPVQEITRTAREIEENNLSRRLEVGTSDEIGDLAKTLNQTFSRLESAFIREREFTADASHELRTPLAIAQGEATLALKENRSPEEYQRSLESISRQIARTSTLINRLLFLARSDDRLELVLTDLDMTSVVNEACADAQILCEPKNIALNCILPDNPEILTVRGDSVRIRELLLNLIDNAVHYTPSSGSIQLSLAHEGDYALIAVQDTGIGIPKEHLKRIFERFYRVDKSRARSEGGVGLGLAISRRIAEVHGGRIEVESEVGVGQHFYRIPAAEKER